MVSWLSLCLTRLMEGLAEELRSKLVEWVVNRVTLGQVVVETDCEDLEQVDIIVEAWLDLLQIEAHPVLLLAVEVIEVEVVK